VKFPVGVVLKYVLPGLLFMGIVTGGIRWWKDYRHWKEVGEQVSVIQDIADEATAEAERLEEVKARQDSTYADSVEVLHDRIASLERADSVSAVREDSLTKHLADLLADNPAALSTLAKLQQEHESRIEALQTIIFSKDEEIAMLHERIATRDSINANLWTALEAERELVGHWKNEAKPKFWRDTGRAAYQMVGAAAIGALTAVAFTQ
jgi:chromosome segregation ATPase